MATLLRRPARRAAGLLALGALVLHTSAFGAFGAHYLGHSQDRHAFRMYLDGGEFLGLHGGLHAIRVTVHLVRRDRLLRAIEGCVYRFDLADRSRDRLECSKATPGALAGVAYARPARPDAAGGEDILQSMVCVQRCGPQVPRRLHLEDADEDNG